MILRYDQGMDTHPEPIDHNHPAVEAARRALASDETNGCMIEQHEGNGMWTCFAHGVSADGPEMCWYVRDIPPIVLEAASEHYTADDLRDTPAGRALMAEALEDEACRMDVVISNGDAAEQAAPAPGETGRGGAVTARDALYENPAQYLRERADAYRTETPDE